MAIDRRRYTEEFKRKAVRLIETSGKPIAQLARDLGINDNIIETHREMGSVERLCAALAYR